MLIVLSRYVLAMWLLLSQFKPLPLNGTWRTNHPSRKFGNCNTPNRWRGRARGSGTRPKLILVVVGALMSVAWSTSSSASGNASNPLAAVNNTDIRYQFFDLGNSDLRDTFIDGAYMLRPDLKLKYELHYNSTDSTGTRQTGFGTANLKLIYFPSQAQLNETWAVKTAVGLEWVLDLGDPSTGIGTGSDQLAPLAGAAFSNKKTGLVLVPLVQHFKSYNGPTDVSLTAMRLIAIQPFADAYWAKLDLIVPYDWANDSWPAMAEFQLGYNIRPGVAAYADLIIGLGSDRSFDQGLGLGIRFSY